MKEAATPDTKNRAAKKEVDMHATPLKSRKLIKGDRSGITTVPTFGTGDLTITV